jgi:hypothetical protein
MLVLMQYCSRNCHAREKDATTQTQINKKNQNELLVDLDDKTHTHTPYDVAN